MVFDSVGVRYDFEEPIPEVPARSEVSPFGEEPDDAGFIGISPAIQEVREHVRRIARTDCPVLLLGETGTGKEVVARLIHKKSGRADRDFLKVNCAALPVELLESELFGHAAGAFTGATRARAGKFEICNHGTIFLDEIAEMPVSPQAKLLHVLQDGEFSRLGSTATTKVDVRVLSATNVDIPQAILGRSFRADLYYRLNAFTIQLPPLRERREDIPLLIGQFMEHWGKLFGQPGLEMSGPALEACLSYNWPGNVRELENFVRRYIISGDEAKSLNELRSDGHAKAGGGWAMPANLGSSATDLKSQVRGLKMAAEKEAITLALKQCQGSRKEAARLLNISLRALQYKIRDYAVEPAQALPAA